MRRQAFRHGFMCTSGRERRRASAPGLDNPIEHRHGDGEWGVHAGIETRAQIGKESCRGRGEISVVAGSLKNKNETAVVVVSR